MSDGPTERPGDDEPAQSSNTDLPGLAAFAVMGMTSAVLEAIGVLLGIWADHVWHSAPAGLLIGVVLGTVAAVVSVVQQIRRFL